MDFEKKIKNPGREFWRVAFELSTNHVSANNDVKEWLISLLARLRCIDVSVIHFSNRMLSKALVVREVTD